ncbi:unnamed protein product [Trichobilharzia regenti]|nr:unnamed protein product [Trichobilharzia regenti]
MSTSSQHPSNSRRIVRTDSAPSSHAHSISNLSNNKRSNHTENSASGHQVNSQSNDSAHSVESTTINTRGHVLQRILFRSYATCDLCQNSCSSVFHPPLAYQCTDCQIKLHAWHLENNDYTLPQCAKAVGVCLLRARTVRDKEQWMEYLLLAIKITKLLSSNIAILKSNNAEVPISSIQQQSNPAITTTRSISLLGCGPSQCKH